MNTTNLPRLVLRPRRAQPFFYRHPWVFDGAIASIEADLGLGDEALLVTDRGDPVARGLFNPDSAIKLRLYNWSAEIPLDDDFFRRRIDHALRLRERLGLLEGDESAGRLIGGEGDGLSGLTVDRYGRWLVVQWTSAALATRSEMLLAHLENRLRPHGIVVRTARGMKSSEALDVSDGVIAGQAPPRPLFIEEHGLRYGVDVLEGQKTGFFLDQRDNRTAAARYLRGSRILDLFCYSGAFGLAALRLGEASSIVGIDASDSAIHLARENARLNGLERQTRYECSSAFDALEKFASAGTSFDGVILDPPKMTRSRKSLPQALKGYFSLNRLAVNLLPAGGILVTSSCSGLVSRTDFAQMLSNVAMHTQRDVQVLEARGAAADHPTMVSCPESDYLQCWICRVE